MPPKTKKQDEVAQAISALADAIKSLENKIDGYYSIKVDSSKLVSNATDTVILPAQETVSTASQEIPFPTIWRAIIDEVLSPQFRASVTYRSDAQFELSIWVPEKYSNAPKSHWDIMKEDKRFQVIPNALGDAGIRTMCDKIAENLGQEIRFRIAQDRATGQ